MSFAIAVLAEAALSFLGFGTPPPTPSWGRMLQESQELLFTAPRLAVVPGRRDRAGRARVQPARRRPARPVRPEAGGPPMSAARAAARRARASRRAATCSRCETSTCHGRGTSVDDVGFTIRPGERVGLIGESGLGQVADRAERAGAAAGGAAADGSVRLDRGRPRPRRCRRAADVPGPRAATRDGLPGADDRAEPDDAGRRPGRRGDADPRHAAGPRRRPGRGRRAARPGAAARPRRRRPGLPAPALRRPAPAGRARHRPGQRPRAAGLRRADDRPRRHRAGAASST